MISRRTQEFRRSLAKLPPDVRRAAFNSYRLFSSNPRHNSVQFKLVNAKRRVYSARVNRDYRVLGILRGEVVTWFWIGAHAEYDQLLKRL